MGTFNIFGPHPHWVLRRRKNWLELGYFGISPRTAFVASLRMLHQPNTWYTTFFKHYQLGMKGESGISSIEANGKKSRAMQMNQAFDAGLLFDGKWMNDGACYQLAECKQTLSLPLCVFSQAYYGRPTQFSSFTVLSLVCHAFV